MTLRSASARRRTQLPASAVRQPVFLDVVAIGFEQHLGAAVLAHLLGTALDHAVALAGLLVQDLALPGNFEALFGPRFGLQLGHLALLLSAVARPIGRNSGYAHN